MPPNDGIILHLVRKLLFFIKLVDMQNRYMYVDMQENCNYIKVIKNIEKQSYRAHMLDVTFFCLYER